MSQTRLDYAVSRETIVIAKAEHCHCRVTIRSYAGREDTRFNVVRCSPRHRRVVEKLKDAVEKAAQQPMLPAA